MKIYNFLKGNFGFSGLNLNILILSSLGFSVLVENYFLDFQRGFISILVDNIDGIFVRDERSGIFIQDEMMDKFIFSSVDIMFLFFKIISFGFLIFSSIRLLFFGREESYFREFFSFVFIYRFFGLGSELFYKQFFDGMERLFFLMDFLQEKFYLDIFFQEDEDYRDFEYLGFLFFVMMNLEKKLVKFILKLSKFFDIIEYQLILFSYSYRV